MGTSTDAQICYGIDLNEGEDLPWREFEEIDDWWLHINGYKKPFELYNEEGNWLNNIEPPKEKVDEYYAHKKAFTEKHPIPVELVFHCSCDYPMYILAVKNTYISVNRGDLLVIKELIIPGKELVDFKKFVDKYLKDVKKPEWYITSWWG